MNYKITIHCHSPKIYLIQAEKNIFIGHKVFKEFRLKLGENKDLDLSSILLNQETYLFNISREYLSLSEKSTSHLERFLLRHCCSSFLREKIIEKMREEQFLNDERYLKIYLENAIRKGNKPYQVLKKELQKKNLHIDYQENPYDELKSLLNLIKKNEYRLKKDKKKFSEYLRRKGFGFDLIKKALSLAENEDHDHLKE